MNPGSLLLPHRSDGGRDGESEKRGGKLRAKGLRMRGAENTETPLWRMEEGEGGGGRGESRHSKRTPHDLRMRYCSREVDCSREMREGSKGPSVGRRGRRRARRKGKEGFVHTLIKQRSNKPDMWMFGLARAEPRQREGEKGSKRDRRNDGEPGRRRAIGSRLAPKLPEKYSRYHRVTLQALRGRGRRGRGGGRGGGAAGAGRGALHGAEPTGSRSRAVGTEGEREKRAGWPDEKHNQD